MKKIATVFLATLVLALGLAAQASKYIQKTGWETSAGTAGNVGVRGTAAYGGLRETRLELAAFSLGNFVNGNSGNGALLWTLPAGAQLVEIARMDIALTASNGDMVNDTPDVGIGQTWANGTAGATLNSFGATTENIITGQTALDANGTTFNGNAASVDLFINTSGTKTIYLNAADAWDGNGEVTVTGEIDLLWYELVD